MLSIPQWLKLPRICLYCHMSFLGHAPICQGCEKKIKPLYRLCFFCSEPTIEEDADICLQCQYLGSNIRRIYVFDEYSEPLKTLITDFKFQNGFDLLNYLGERLIHHLPKEALQTQCLIPVPLHRKKHRLRGYHQTQLLAKYLHHRLQIPMSTKFCKKIKNTPAQSQLKFIERQKNLDHAFDFQKPPYQKITLIDDIITTGSTLKTIAQGFQALGVEQIDCWCLAKALR